MKTAIPQGYVSKLSVMETEIAIKLCKDIFERQLMKNLNLTRVSAPLFVKSDSGLNDNLSGSERPVVFDIKDLGINVEIVHSLAKWKRYALGKYGFKKGTGLLTDMDAIRRDEVLDNIHSVYVDQWDWEKVIDISDRNINFLKKIVDDIYMAFKETGKVLKEAYPLLDIDLPDQITFITSQQLEDQYPSLSPSEREDKAAREYGAIFVNGIGGKLRSGTIHDRRAPDYDDWALNGDIIIFDKVLDRAVEFSSMGIRVDAESMKKQLELSGCMKRTELPFHQGVLNSSLPLSVGGGIGQSRLCLFFLNKAHIGEVHASVWSDETVSLCVEKGVELL